MKLRIEKALSIAIICLFLSLGASFVSAEASFDEITLDPTEPEVLSTFTITAKITSGETIQEVKAIIQECKEGFCYSGEEVTLTKVSDGEYEGTATLTHEDADELKYHVEAKINDVWEESSSLEIDLSTASGNNNDDSKNTPGFEIVVFIAALFVSLILIRKKRLQ